LSFGEGQADAPSRFSFFLLYLLFSHIFKGTGKANFFDFHSTFSLLEPGYRAGVLENRDIFHDID